MKIRVTAYVRLLAASTLLFLFASFSVAQQYDSVICQRVFHEAQRQRIAELPMGEAVVWVGKEFLGSPYAAHTLEQPGEERLVINLREFDCVTFVESVIALARCIKAKAFTFEEYKAELQRIRYRGGMLNGYPSRLHYFSEWIDDNTGKALVKNVTHDLGGVSYRKQLDWMSAHRNSYRQLADTEAYRAIQDIEKRLSQRELRYIPTSSVKKVERQMHNGDIIALVSTLEGLDIGHVGIAVKEKDGVHYMHAPNEKGVVKITREVLSEYLVRQRSFSGIMVARPVE